VKWERRNRVFRCFRYKQNWKHVIHKVLCFSRVELIALALKSRIVWGIFSCERQGSFEWNFPLFSFLLSLLFSTPSSTSSQPLPKLVIWLQQRSTTSLPLLPLIFIWINRLRLLFLNQRSSMRGLAYWVIRNMSSLSKSLGKLVVDGERFLLFRSLKAPHGDWPARFERHRILPGEFPTVYDVYHCLSSRFWRQMLTSQANFSYFRFRTPFRSRNNSRAWGDRSGKVFRTLPSWLLLRDWPETTQYYRLDGLSINRCQWSYAGTSRFHLARWNVHHSPWKSWRRLGVELSCEFRSSEELNWN